jgi:hypothetical protein
MYFSDLRLHIRQLLENPPLVEDENMQNKFEDFYNRGYDILNKWNDQLQFDNLLWEGKYLLLKISNDPTTLKIIEDFKSLGRDIVYDSRGRPSFSVTSENVQQIRSLLMPLVMENLREIPIPVIEGSTPKYDYKFTGLLFKGYDILPENVKVHMISDLDVNVTGSGPTKYPTSVLTFKFRNIKLHLRNVQFDFYRKVVPRIHDKGIADMDISGDRTRIAIKWQVTFTEIGPIFTLLKAKTHIKNFDINVKEAHHKWLYNFVTKIFHGTVKENIESAVDNRLKELLLTTEKTLNEGIRGGTKGIVQTPIMVGKEQEIVATEVKPSPLGTI